MGYGAHINKPLDAVRFKYRDEFRDRSRRVADGIYTQGQMVTALVAGYCFQPLSRLAPNGLLKRRKLSLDVHFQAATLDDVLAIPAQEIVDGLDADANRPRRLILIQILE